jgi:hypothetical protein
MRPAYPAQSRWSATIDETLATFANRIEATSQRLEAFAHYLASLPESAPVSASPTPPADVNLGAKIT